MRQDLTKQNARSIRAWLASRGLKVSDLAAGLGVTDATVYNWLNGRRPWTARAARFVSLTTGVALRALLDPCGDAADSATVWLRDLEERETKIAAQEVAQ